METTKVYLMQKASIHTPSTRLPAARVRKVLLKILQVLHFHKWNRKAFYKQSTRTPQAVYTKEQALVV
jgi:hypothetical protein